MIRSTRFIVCVGAAAVALLAARAAEAQVMCNDATLTNPTIVAGSSAFEPTLKALAVKLAAETTPTTIIYTTGTNANGSCTGVAALATGLDLGGTAGRYYTVVAGAITNNACTFAAGQKADLAVSDVFYESCTNVTQPQPATIIDIPGPAQAMLFVVPKTNTTTQYLTNNEAGLIYGCGTKTGTPFTDPTGVFCRDPNSGTQITIAKNIGVPQGVMIAPVCVPSSGTAGVVTNVTTFATASSAIGFIAADAFDGQRANLNSLAFQAAGQTQAYYSDSGPTVADRRNVRDGHYTIWGYQHLIAAGTGTTASNAKAADLIGYVLGTKTSANFDAIAIESGAGAIPQCAMKVKRTTDGGLLSPYTPAAPCGCAFEAAITKATPAGCTACTGTGMGTCAAGKTCTHGFCE